MRITSDPTDPPTDDVTTRLPSLVAACDKYLDSLPCSSWGRVWYIESSDDQMEAAKWLAQTIEGVLGNGRTQG